MVEGGTVVGGREGVGGGREVVVMVGGREGGGGGCVERWKGVAVAGSVSEDAQKGAAPQGAALCRWHTLDPPHTAPIQKCTWIHTPIK